MNSTKYLLVLLAAGNIFWAGYFLLFALSALQNGGDRGLVTLTFNDYGEMRMEIGFLFSYLILIIITTIIGINDENKTMGQ